MSSASSTNLPGATASSSSTTTVAPPPVTPKLQMLNYVNVVAYLFNFAVVFGSTKAGLPDNSTVSKDYQTLITPAPYAFAIWGIIFFSELVWTVVQVLPSYRSHPLVVKGVGYKFSLASFFQGLWMMVFSLRKIDLSLLAIFGILIPLLAILAKISSTTSWSITTITTITYLEYWLLKFPFEIHASWVIAATLLNVNLLLVASKADAVVQASVGWLTLTILFGVGVSAVVRKGGRGRIWVVPCVVVWAAFAIAKELSDPIDTIRERFAPSTIQHTYLVSSAVGFGLLLIVTVELIRDKLFSKFEDDVLDSDEESEARGEYSPLH